MKCIKGLTLSIYKARDMKWIKGLTMSIYKEQGHEAEKSPYTEHLQGPQT